MGMPASPLSRKERSSKLSVAMAQNLQKGAFYLDSDIYNRPSDGFQHSLLNCHISYQYQKHGYLGDSQCPALPRRQNVLADHQTIEIQRIVAHYPLLTGHRDIAI